MSADIDWGPIAIVDWFDELRIGCYDDDTEDEDDDEDCGVVYIGDMFLAMSAGYHTIPHHHLRPVTTDDLWTRRAAIHKQIGPGSGRHGTKGDHELLLELAYVDGVLMDRLFVARFSAKGRGKRKVFIFHSSTDKQFAKWLAVDLSNAGHNPWLDEWDIHAGDSIPTQIGIGIEQCDFVLVVLSLASVQSFWVEREWQAKYWAEAQENRTMVVPVLLEDCEVPTLLKAKKYADFRSDYNAGLEVLLASFKRRPVGKGS